MQVCIQVPATTANLGPGYDTLGLALNIHNYLEIDTNADTLTFDIQGEGSNKLSTNKYNLVYQALSRVYMELGMLPPPVKIKQVNRIPLSSGLGSSAAAIVGGLTAANCLLGNPLSKHQLLKLACEIEGHPDNVAPALFGGLIITGVSDRNTSSEVFYRAVKVINPPQVIAVIPEKQLSTHKARSVVPQQIPLADAIFNLSRISVLVSCFASGDYAKFSTGCEDRLHQKHRFSLLPGLSDVIDSCLSAGALGAAISGSGPTVVGFTHHDAENIAVKMQQAFTAHNIPSRFLITQIADCGVNDHY